MTKTDPLEKAFELLRYQVQSPLPDPKLEALLRLRFRCRGKARKRHRLPLFLLAFGVLGAGAAAAGALEWVQSWRYALNWNGQSVSGILQNGETARLPFETLDGRTGEVRLRRDAGPDGSVNTQLQMSSEGQGRFEDERLQQTVNGGPEPRYALSVLDAAVLLHSGSDAEGKSIQFFGVTDEDGGSRLLVLDGSQGKWPVVELARLPFDLLDEDAELRFIEVGPGSLELSLTGPRGGVLEFAWSSGGVEDELEMQSRDGSVRARVEPLGVPSESFDR